MVPRPRLPGRKPKDDASEAKTKEAKAKKPSKLSAAKISGPKAASAKEPTADKPAAKTSASAAKAPASKASKPPAPNLQERMEGLQGWLAEIERKQGRMTYFGAAALLVAVLASAAALYFGISNQQNSADKDDVNALEERVTEVGDSLKSSTEDQLKTLNGRVDSIEGRLDTIEQKQKQTDATIGTLQTQINSQATAKGTGTTGTTPGTTTTPTPKPNP
jgi:uncharacterized protein HemX